MDFNTDPAGSQKPSASALGPPAGDSYGEEMLSSGNPGRPAGFSELPNEKTIAGTFVQDNQKSRCFSNKSEEAQFINKLKSQKQSTQKHLSGRKFTACNIRSPPNTTHLDME